MEGKQQFPVMVYFHGGSWSEGKPDWVFPSCNDLAKDGWVAVSVEYRLAYRHGTLPFESVMDAKSAIRWLRMHAGEYNIDTNRIVVSGNSAGGHLALCTALVRNWNDPLDDLSISAEPNLILVNSGVYDLTDENSWIRQGLRESGRDEGLVEEISPVYLVREGLPPVLIIHGTSDRNVAFSTAEVFVNRMKDAGNTVEFKVLEGANHYIWFGEYAQLVSEKRKDFLGKHSYD
jgi:acetyl esterase/lipase